LAATLSFSCIARKKSLKTENFFFPLSPVKENVVEVQSFFFLFRGHKPPSLEEEKNTRWPWSVDNPVEKAKFFNGKNGLPSYPQL
jgi:hypothetical protein